METVISSVLINEDLYFSNGDPGRQLCDLYAAYSSVEHFLTSVRPHIPLQMYSSVGPRKSFSILQGKLFCCSALDVYYFIVGKSPFLVSEQPSPGSAVMFRARFFTVFVFVYHPFDLIRFSIVYSVLDNFTLFLWSPVKWH